MISQLKNNTKITKVTFCVLAVAVALFLVMPHIVCFSQDAPMEEDHDKSNLRSISVVTLNRFHLALLARVIIPIREQVSLTASYCGIVATDNGQKKRRIHGSLGAPLQWHMSDESGNAVFTFQISKVRRPFAVSSCRLDDEIVFVEILGVDGPSNEGKLIHMRRKELGGLSILDVIKLLESEPGELERRKE